MESWVRSRRLPGGTAILVQLIEGALELVLDAPAMRSERTDDECEEAEQAQVDEILAPERAVERRKEEVEGKTRRQRRRRSPAPPAVPDDAADRG